MPYVLTTGGSAPKYHSLYGWLVDKRQATQFRTKDEALAHGAREGLTGALAELVQEAPPPGVDPNGGATIFGYGKAPARG